MKTFKTNLGIEYDVEIIGVGMKSIDIIATCEEGVEEFTLTFPFEIKEDEAFYSRVLDRDCSDITEDDLSEVSAWVNEITVGFIAKEVAVWCLRKSSDKYYWSFDISRFKGLGVSLYKLDMSNDMKVVESHYLYGEEGIKEFLRNNK